MDALPRPRLFAATGFFLLSGPVEAITLKGAGATLPRRSTRYAPRPTGPNPVCSSNTTHWASEAGVAGLQSAWSVAEGFRGGGLVRSRAEGTG